MCAERIPGCTRQASHSLRDTTMQNLQNLLDLICFLILAGLMTNNLCQNHSHSGPLLLVADG